MKDKSNTVAGWVLGAGIVALGGSLVAGTYFKGHRPETMGYPIAGVAVEGEGEEAERPIEFYLASADVARGAEVYKKCQACHTINKGGANGLGPNLYNNMFQQIAHVAGFNYSEALKARHSETWDWQRMSEWLKNPRQFAPGTKMTFAGLSDPAERANIIAYLNSMSDAPRPLPAAPVEATPGAAADQAAAEADDAGGQKAENEPVLNEQQALKGGTANIGGEGAPRVTAPGTTATPAPKQ